MRVALADAAPFYRDAELEHDPRDRGTLVLRDFMSEVAPDVGEDREEVAMATIKMTMSEMGRRISEERDLSARSEVYADAVADMFCAYIGNLAGEA